MGGGGGLIAQAAAWLKPSPGPSRCVRMDGNGSPGTSGGPLVRLSLCGAAGQSVPWRGGTGPAGNLSSPKHKGAARDYHDRFVIQGRRQLCLGVHVELPHPGEAPAPPSPPFFVPQTGLPSRERRAVRLQGHHERQQQHLAGAVVAQPPALPGGRGKGSPPSFPARPRGGSRPDGRSGRSGVAPRQAGAPQKSLPSRGSAAGSYWPGARRGRWGGGNPAQSSGHFQRLGAIPT